MTRAVKEWIGKTPDTQPPPRVRIRVFLAGDKRCGHCTRQLRPGDHWDLDHVQALINGGENREANLQVLCRACHGAKTAGDVKEKAGTARVRAKHYGVRKKPGRPMPGTKASRWHKKMNGTVEERQ
jgi:5-methylcytosine-specific restriction endonuclease McrA